MVFHCRNAYLQEPGNLLLLMVARNQTQNFLLAFG
ncbi:hypothetical protein ABAC402_15290 [Asticcacaulis sp. AC402]|nr:hypothetical protein ABAC402_15290 [Asticcacaulis sp. AC402]